MNRVVFLDSGPLGMVTHRGGVDEVDASNVGHLDRLVPAEVWRYQQLFRLLQRRYGLGLRYANTRRYDWRHQGQNLHRRQHSRRRRFPLPKEVAAMKVQTRIQAGLHPALEPSG